MVDEQNVETNNPGIQADKAVAPVAKRRRSAASRKTAGTASSKAKPAETDTLPGKLRRYSQIEKAQKLAQIEAQVAEGATLKAAVKATGISEQTFYQWKRAATAQTVPVSKPSAEIETLADLVELEAENKRLRNLLAEKLRAENAELRKRLRLD